DADNLLPVDFDNVLSVEAFLHLVKDRGGATLTEVFPGPDELVAHGPSERFTHELIIPFVRQIADFGLRISDLPKGESNRDAAESRTGVSTPAAPQSAIRQ